MTDILRIASPTLPWDNADDFFHYCRRNSIKGVREDSTDCLVAVALSLNLGKVVQIENDYMKWDDTYYLIPEFLSFIVADFDAGNLPEFDMYPENEDDNTVDTPPNDPSL